MGTPGLAKTDMDMEGRQCLGITTLQKLQALPCPIICSVSEFVHDLIWRRSINLAKPRPLKIEISLYSGFDGAIVLEWHWRCFDKHLPSVV